MVWQRLLRLPLRRGTTPANVIEVLMHADLTAPNITSVGHCCNCFCVPLTGEDCFGACMTHSSVAFLANGGAFPSSRCPSKGLWCSRARCPRHRLWSVPRQSVHLHRCCFALRQARAKACSSVPIPASADQNPPAQAVPALGLCSWIFQHPSNLRPRRLLIIHRGVRCRHWSQVADSIGAARSQGRNPLEGQRGEPLGLGGPYRLRVALPRCARTSALCGRRDRLTCCSS